MIVAAAGFGVVAAGTWVKACAHCRRSYGRAEWAILTTVAQVPPASVQEHLSVPAAWTVELRRCECGVILAALAP